MTSRLVHSLLLLYRVLNVLEVADSLNRSASLDRECPGCSKDQVPNRVRRPQFLELKKEYTKFDVLWYSWSEHNGIDLTSVAHLRSVRKTVYASSGI